MPIFHVTYLSNNLKVKGYLGIPDRYHSSETCLNAHLARLYGDRTLPPVQVLSQSIAAKEDLQNQQLPALIYCRGGIGRVGKVKLDWVHLFANFGFVVFAPSYRGNEGGEGRDEFGGADRSDVHAAFHLLQSFPFVKLNRISVLGFSRGSINAAQTAVEVPGVHRLICWGGVSDLAKTYEERIDLRRMLKRVLGGTPQKVPDKYSARSPIRFAESIPCPVLIVHGRQDVQVDVSHGLALHQELQRLGSPVEMHCYYGYGHHLPSPVHEAVVERMLDWLEQPINQGFRC